MASHARRLALRLGSAGLVAAAALRCYPPTEMVLDIRTDLDCAANEPKTQIRVGGEIVAETTQCTPDGAGKSSIGTLTFVPSGDPEARATLEVVVAVDGASVAECGAQPDKCASARRSFSYVEHASRRLPIELSRVCLGKACPGEQTCVDGACVDTAVACEGDRCDVPQNLASADAGGGTSGMVGVPCAVGETRCDGRVLLVCGPDGFRIGDTCATPKLCERREGEACRLPLCASGEGRCLGKIYVMCSEQRDELLEAARCGPGQTCVPGAGCVDVVCSPGYAYCDHACAEAPEIPTTNDCLWTCDATGTRFELTDCGHAQQGSTTDSCSEPTPGEGYCHRP